MVAILSFTPTKSKAWLTLPTIARLTSNGADCLKMLSRQQLVDVRRTGNTLVRLADLLEYLFG